MYMNIINYKNVNFIITIMILFLNSIITKFDYRTALLKSHISYGCETCKSKYSIGFVFCMHKLHGEVIIVQCMYTSCSCYLCYIMHFAQDAPIDGHTKYDDGWYGGKRLFESQINRGLFLPLKGLHPDRRFTSDEPVELPNRKLS